MSLLFPLSDDIVIHNIIGRKMDIWLALVKALPLISRTYDSEFWKNHFGFTLHRISACDICKTQPTLEHVIQCALDCALKSQPYYIQWGWNRADNRPLTTVSTQRLPLECTESGLVQGIKCVVGNSVAEFGINGELFQYTEWPDKEITLEYKHNPKSQSVSIELTGDEMMIDNNKWKVCSKRVHSTHRGFEWSVTVSKNNIVVYKDDTCRTFVDFTEEEVIAELRRNARRIEFDEKTEFKERVDRKMFQKMFTICEDLTSRECVEFPTRYGVYCCERCDHNIAVPVDHLHKTNTDTFDFTMHCGCEHGKLLCVLEKGAKTPDVFGCIWIDTFCSSQGRDGFPSWIQAHIREGAPNYWDETFNIWRNSMLEDVSV